MDWNTHNGDLSTKKWKFTTQSGELTTQHMNLSTAQIVICSYVQQQNLIQGVNQQQQELNCSTVGFTMIYCNQQIWE